MEIFIAKKDGLPMSSPIFPYFFLNISAIFKITVPYIQREKKKKKLKSQSLIDMYNTFFYLYKNQTDISKNILNKFNFYIRKTTIQLIKFSRP